MIGIEAKSMGKDGKINLSSINDPINQGERIAQNSNGWYLNAAKKLQESLDPKQKRLGEVIQREIEKELVNKQNTFIRAIVAVDKVKEEIVVQKILN